VRAHCDRVLRRQRPGPDDARGRRTAQLRDDKRFESVREETRQEAYDRFKEIFADQPDLVENASPESLPASVQLVVRKGSTGKQVEGALREEFPDSEVTVRDWCPPPQ
jgi:cell division protein FtsX